MQLDWRVLLVMVVDGLLFLVEGVVLEVLWFCGHALSNASSPPGTLSSSMGEDMPQPVYLVMTAWLLWMRLSLVLGDMVIVRILILTQPARPPLNYP